MHIFCNFKAILYPFGPSKVSFDRELNFTYIYVTFIRSWHNSDFKFGKNETFGKKIYFQKKIFSSPFCLKHAQKKFQAENRKKYFYFFFKSKGGTLWIKIWKIWKRLLTRHDRSHWHLICKMFRLVKFRFFWALDDPAPTFGSGCKLCLSWRARQCAAIICFKTRKCAFFTINVRFKLHLIKKKYFFISYSCREFDSL